MKTFFYITILTLLMPFCIHAQDAKNGAIWINGFSDGVIAAKKSNQDVLVYFNGSDWCPPAVRFKNAILDARQTRESLGNKFVFVEIDHRNSIDEAGHEANKKANDALKLSIENYPHIVLADAEGRPYAELACSPISTDGILVRRILAAQEIKAARDKCFSEAEKTDGVNKALALGRGLDVLSPRIAGQYKAVVDAMKKADPQDQSGYVTKYTFHPNGFLEGSVLRPADKKDFEEAEQAIAKMLANDKLSQEQKLNVMAARIALLNKQGKRAEMLEALKAIIKVAPRSDMAVGAQGYLDFLEKPVVLPNGKWDGAACRNPGIWLVDASKVVKKSGRYDVILEHTDGGDRQRVTEVSLVAGEQVLATEKKEQVVGPGNKRVVYSLTVSSVPSGKKIEARVNARCEGWWWSSAGVISVEAK
jgi:thioredoxin-related protein